jgi:hypothetical protein
MALRTTSLKDYTAYLFVVVPAFVLLTFVVRKSEENKPPTTPTIEPTVIEITATSEPDFVCYIIAEEENSVDLHCEVIE